MPHARFLCGVAAILFDAAAERYLIMQRASTKMHGAYEWECVTGHVEHSESFEQAVHREVREETGLSVTIQFIVKTSHFYDGPPDPEHELMSVQYFCTVDDPIVLRLDAEHSQFQWLTAAEIFALLSPNHWFHQAVYIAESMRYWSPPALRQFWRTRFNS